MKTKYLHWIVSVVIAVLMLAACGTPAPSGTGAQPEESASSPAEERRGPGNLEPPPPVTVHFFDQSAELDAWTYCYGNGCADGMPPDDPLHVGDPDEVVVEFPLEGWSFEASFKPAGERCGRVQTVPLEALGDGRFELRPAGHADEYDVTLIGRGDGDLFVSFRWTTRSDGPLPTPHARLAVLADHDGVVDSYGVELEVAQLARTPEQSAATITVTARAGESLTFEAKLARSICAEGTLYWDGPDDQGLAAAKLGEAPFEYEVELVLDGERYVARATWPDDEIKGNEPSVALHFEPDLPALS